MTNRKAPMTAPSVQVVYTPDRFTLPARYKDHPADRLASTPGDNLAEFSARLCYDSLNKERARPTAEYHKNIHASKHHSVVAHLVETFEVRGRCVIPALVALQGRPGVWVTGFDGSRLRFCLSLRAVLEWPRHGLEFEPLDPATTDVRLARAYLIADILTSLTPRFPLVLAPGPDIRPDVSALDFGDFGTIESVPPETDHEVWASLYMEGISRDLLQELVRHHYQANPSVRSTRYVDEGESHQVLHPALAAGAEDLPERAQAHFATAKARYRETYAALVKSGVDAKTARGAARSLLPGATETRLVYSLSRFQAKHILGLRLDQTSGPADPEIVRLAGLMRAALRGIDWDV